MRIGEDLRKLRIALSPRSWKLTTTLSNGVVVLGINREGYGGRGVFVYRDALEPELQHLDQFIDRDGVFVDIGASTGVYTLKAAKHYYPAGTVVAIEPFVTVLSSLAESVAANGLSNVRLRNLCVGERTGARMLWMNKNKPHAFSITNRIGEAKGLSVLAVSLDDLFEWEALDRLDYLKIDAEGAEPEILRGGARTLRRHRPIVQLETTISAVGCLEGYLAFKAPRSPNAVMIPEGHPKADLPLSLGWERIKRANRSGVRPPI